MNLIQNIMLDVDMLLQRIKEELKPHPRVTQAQQFIEGARIELALHPDATQNGQGALFDDLEANTAADNSRDPGSS